MDKYWIKDKENQKKLLCVLIGINLLAISSLLFITASNQGPLYELIKPEVEYDYYIYLDQNIEDGILTLIVIPTDNDSNPIDDKTKIYLTDKYERVSLVENSTIVVSRIVQITGEEQTTVTSYNPNIDIPNDLILI